MKEIIVGLLEEMGYKKKLERYNESQYNIIHPEIGQFSIINCFDHVRYGFMIKIRTISNKYIVLRDSKNEPVIEICRMYKISQGLVWIKYDLSEPESIASIKKWFE